MAQQFLGSGLGTGLSPHQSCSPVGAVRALTFLQGRGSAAEQPVQHCLWPQHLGMQTMLLLLIFLSWTLVCVLRACAQVFLCPQWDCKRQTAARFNPATTLAALPCCHDRAFSRRGGATAQFIHFLCSYHIGKEAVGTRLQSC